ncbi:MAG: zinc-binding dehydrogenase family superfamily [Lasallia pustulata]|uniref:Zinc-binding dehydrogenase family superfamily n=1 Tax=Lasallia pustulata TaxID=136370 RepID=A0A5M8PJW4_9LECA|nr:MAG: zinc-binding dehydrogenase family superfamily [Lasallia pustulata]
MILITHNLLILSLLFKPEMPSNTAAWLLAQKVRPLAVKSAPYTPPGENEVVVKNGALALNLVDWARQDLGDALFSWTTYPCVLGSDVAGEVVEVGTGVSRFQTGDRVTGLAIGLTSNRPADGAFQSYTILPEHMASPIPSTLSYESASVLPLGLSTAACGLFQKDYLALQLPSSPPEPATGDTLLIWGGSSSVGSNAIQLAVAAGYEVIATASPKNFDYVKKLGASQVFDYHSETVVADLVKAFNGKASAGALAIGNGSAEPCVEVVHKCRGKKFVALANPPSKELPSDVAVKFIFGSDLKDNEVGPAIFVNFLPKALEDGSFIAAPDAEVVGEGLESVQGGLDLLKKGVSAKKYVISL